LRLLAALGAIEDDPDHGIVGKVLEAVVDSRGHKENVTGPEWMALSAIPKSSASLHHDVNLVFGVRGLRILPPRCVDLDAERAVGEQLGKSLSVGARQTRQRLTKGEQGPRHPAVLLGVAYHPYRE